MAAIEKELTSSTNRMRSNAIYGRVRPSIGSKVRTHLCGNALAGVIRRALHEYDMNIVVAGSFDLAVHGLPTAYIGIVCVQNESDKLHNGPFADILAIDLD